MIDEPIDVVEYDPSWSAAYEADAAELRTALGLRLRAVEHFGSTSVEGMAAKPVIDVLVAPVAWPLTEVDRATLAALGYEHLGEAGVPGRHYFRRRRPRATNLAVVEFEGALWRDNLAIRDYLRAHAEARREYSTSKRDALARGARTLLAYSADKAPEVAALLAAARRWRDRA